MMMADPSAFKTAAPRPQQWDFDLVYIHAGPIPAEFANAVQVVRMCEAFQAMGCDTSLLAPGDVNACLMREYGLKVPVRRLKAPPVWLPGRAVVSILAAAAARPHRRSRVIFTRSGPVARAAALLRQPFVLEMHLPLAAHSPKMAAILRHALRSPHLLLLVVITQTLKQDYLAVEPGLEGRVLVAHDGAQVRSAPPPPPGGSRLQIGYTGQLFEGKGMETINALARRCGWADFHVVGGTDSTLAAWRKATRDCPNLVLHGAIPHGQVAERLDGFDIVLAPYRSVVRGSGVGGQNLANWMSPLKLFEYMERARPIIASDLPVLREVLEDGKNCLLCPPEDISAWEAALERLRDDSALRLSLGEQARNDILAGYSWERRAASILDAVALARRHA